MLPVLGALILQAAYGAVDLLVVGRFGSTSGLSAVSTGSQLLNLVTFVVTQLAMGVTVLIARYIGEKREKDIGAVLGGAAVVFTILAAVLFVLLVGFARPIAVLMQAPEEAVSLTTSYVRICGCGILFIVAYNLLSAVFRGLGDSRSPLLFVLVACLVNVAGDLILVAGLHLDAAGAAIATVLAQAVSVVCALVILFRKNLPFTITKRDVRLNEQCGRFLSIGLPLALQEFLTQLSFLALCAFVNRLGLAASSGYGVASKIVNFVMLVPSALMQSMASFVAQNIGAGNPRRAKKSMLTGIAVGVAFGCVMFVLVMLVYMFFQDTFDLSAMLQGMQNGIFSKFFPRCGNNGCLCIFLTQHMHALFYLFISHHLCTAHNNCRCMLYLIFEEFSKVLHVHLRFFTIYNSDSSIDLDICIFLYCLDCSGYIG